MKRKKNECNWNLLDTNEADSLSAIYIFKYMFLK